MRAQSLADLRCPRCSAALSPSEDQIELVFGRLDEIREGLLVCNSCEEHYPVIAGVAILVENPLTYLAMNYAAIVKEAGKWLSTSFSRYLESKSLDLLSEDTTSVSVGWRRDYSPYIFAHYERLETAPNSEALRRTMAVPYGDWYSEFLAMASRHMNTGDKFLDIGSNVGGLVHRAAPRFKLAYGVDLSFSAVLLARQLVLGEPEPLGSYRLQREGARYESRDLKIATRTNAEFVVASVAGLPFPQNNFDLVTCANLIDIVPRPDQLTQAVHAVIRPNGFFLTTDPYFWHLGTASLESWAGGRNNETSADAMRKLVSEQFVVVDERDMVPWLLRYYDRYCQLFFNHHILAKSAAGVLDDGSVG